MSATEQIPVISLWNPWASWVIRGWKPIETRLHDRFKILEGRWVGIHASQRWDEEAISIAARWLNTDQLAETERFRSECGRLIGMAHANGVGWLANTRENSRRALINCESVNRFGIPFDKVERWEPRYMRGKQGIWYIDKP